MALTMIATVGLMAACSTSGSQVSGPQNAASQLLPAPASTSTASVTSTPQEFVSNHYHYAVTSPQGWSDSDAIIDWDGTALAGPGAESFDDLADLASDRTLMTAAAKVPPGTRLADWQEAMVRATPGVCAKPSTVRSTTLGGEPALAWTITCRDGYDVNNIAAVHGERGYIMYLPSATANDNAEDGRIFEGFRRSFHFTS